jgi:hypothetical protein
LEQVLRWLEFMERLEELVQAGKVVTSIKHQEIHNEQNIKQTNV